MARNDGLDVVHVRDRGMLETADHVVLERAHLEDLVFVTCNVADFVKLARARELHPGIVLIEDGALLREEQLEVVRKAVAILQNEADLVNRVLRIWYDGSSVFEEIPSATND